MLTTSLLILALLVSITDATFSIGAVDMDGGLMGAAGASCVFFRSIYDILYVSVESKGVLLTQAKPAPHDSEMVTTAKQMMMSETDPETILEVITDPSIDNTTENVTSDCEEGPVVTYDDYELRQYGLVDTQGRFDAYEDATLKEYYFDLCFTEEAFANISYTQEHIGGVVETDQKNFAYTAQGNIIALPTVPGIVDGFKLVDSDDESCENDLADRLFHAISAPFLLLEEAIAQEDLDLVAGDVRCLGQNQAAAAGIFLHVEDSEGNPVIHIDIENDGRDDGTYNPFPDFVAQYKEWRDNNPCGNDGGNSTSPPATSMEPSSSPASTMEPSSSPTSSASSEPIIAVFGVSAAALTVFLGTVA